MLNVDSERFQLSQDRPIYFDNRLLTYISSIA